MSDRIQALREQRAARAKELNTLVNAETWDRARDESKADALLAEVEDIDNRIKRISDANKLLAETALNNGVIDAALRNAKDKNSENNRLLASFLSVGFDRMTAEDQAKFQTGIQANQTVGTGTQGGYLVPTEIAKSILDALKQFGGMRQVATILTTSMGNQINYPTSDGRSEVGVLVGEGAQATQQDLSLGTIPFNVYRFSSTPAAITWELLQDSVVDIEAFVRQRLVTRLGRVTNNYYTTGTGTSQPQGIITAVTTGKTGATGQTTTVIYDDLVDLEHSVDPAYRALGNCSFMMADDSVRILRKIKDGIGRPIFSPGYEDSLAVGGPSGGAPDRIMGYPININQSMPVMAANAKSITFGDHSFYTIRDVMAVEMLRYADSPFLRQGLIGYEAFMRSGGALIDVGGAVKAYANSAT
jgi:HK97 family phage major capsid protein